MWTPSTIDPAVCVRVRELLAVTAQRQRLAPDFASDTVRWSSRTGTVLNLRHEIGVAQHTDGATFAVAALSESRIPAAQQPGAEAVLGAVARALHDHLRAIRSYTVDNSDTAAQPGAVPPVCTSAETVSAPRAGSRSRLPLPCHPRRRP